MTKISGKAIEKVLIIKNSKEILIQKKNKLFENCFDIFIMSIIHMFFFEYFLHLLLV